MVFGHAKDGNVHFLVNERFDDEVSLERYRRFTDDMVDLVLAQDGTLKAEHGTGRIITPFVRRQYGDELYEVMRELKALCDPTGRTTVQRFRDLRVGGFPFTIIIDKQGRVAAVYVSALLQQYIEPVVTKLAAES